MRKKVLKLTASSTVTSVAGSKKQCVRISFQNYKDGHELINDGSEVIIYRRHTPGYIFDYDEREYFDCLPPPTEDEVVFRGHLPDLHTFCEWDDTDAEVGKVYAYWVGKGEIGESITGPVAVKMRDRRVWWHYSEVLEKSYALARDFESVEVEEIGKTAHGLPLIAIYVGNRENRIACLGAVHAGESGPEILLTALRDILSEDPAAFAECGIAVLPTVNADMREEMVNGAPWYIRKNARGVDLNRNLDADWENIDYSYGLSSADPKSPTYRGPYPDSEPESQAMIKFVEKVKPRLIFSYHFLCSVSTDRLISSGAAADDKGYINALTEVSRIYAKAFRRAADLPPRKSDEVSLICSAGSLITWAYKRGIVAFDIEMSEDIQDIFPSKKDITTPEMLARAIEGHKAALLDILDFCK